MGTIIFMINWKENVQMWLLIYPQGIDKIYLPTDLYETRLRDIGKLVNTKKGDEKYRGH